VSSKVFYRNLHGSYESVVSADGMYLRTAAGQRILDAVGGAGTVVLGHAVREITDAIARHGSEISFSYGATFTNPWQEELAEALVAMNPRIASRVYFVSGGSEGVETAVKMARQYHLQCGRPGRHKVIARWQSFHGSTLATLGLSGRPAAMARRDGAVAVALTASWASVWIVYGTYTWTAAPQLSTLQAARFYVPALGAIALLGAWLLTRVPPVRVLRRVPLTAVTTVAVVAALFTAGNWAFSDMYQHPFGSQLQVGPGGTVQPKLGPGVSTGGPGRAGG
jgi:hypothetical protein